ncbi:hypothetical protein BV898_14543 [Hypsibius exemplaris]|uniref:Uncharacterized protein n=1 Tax=Hypsibius exemplaris TaxID=2072580 RepID=A0A9X6N902_HYPEX|nr:hypothetical protein BV898_14543 [Hypsibius exemplaris]
MQDYELGDNQGKRLKHCIRAKSSAGRDYWPDANFQQAAPLRCLSPSYRGWDNKGLSGQTKLVPFASWKTDDGVVFTIRVNHEERRWRFHVLGPIAKLKEPIPDAIWNAWEHFSDATVWNPTQLVALIKQATELNMWSRRAHKYALLALQAYCSSASKLELPRDWELVEQFVVHGGNLLTVCYSPAHNEAALIIKRTDNWRNVVTDFWFGVTSLFGRRYSAGVLDPCACGCARFPGLHEAMEIG